MEDSTRSTSGTINIEKLDEEAYGTLVDWAKSASGTIKQLEAEGKKEELKNFKLQIKLVVKKLQEIELVLNKNKDELH